MPTPISPRLNPLTNSHTRTRPTPYSWGEWRVVQCEETGMVYLENPPSYDRLAEEFAWEKTYEEEKQRRYQDEPVLSRVSGMVKWMRWNLKGPRIVATSLAHLQALEEIMPSGTHLQFLDVGCGDGKKTVQIPELMKQRGLAAVSPIGIEVSTAQAVEAQSRFKPFGGRCIPLTVLDGLAEIEDTSIHLIVLCSFLEHEVQPVELLTACCAKLARKGRIIIKVPNFDLWHRRVRQEKWCGFRYPNHVNYFTPDTLGKVVHRAGLRERPKGWADIMPTSDEYVADCRTALSRCRESGTSFGRYVNFVSDCARGNLRGLSVSMPRAFSTT
ncbi:MAG: methyltransferase domain-containing protein [Candidatus Synoicihabitans palmerolidicus]|nr:methyltransferase domain-containing protein [Candidatus Synoicihabitans palmerolidicus]